MRTLHPALGYQFSFFPSFFGGFETFVGKNLLTTNNYGKPTEQIMVLPYFYRPANLNT